MSSFRLIAGFLISFKAADWILALGYLKTFGIYSAIMAFFSLMLPAVYFYGKRMRLWSAGQFETSSARLASQQEGNMSMTSLELSKTWSNQKNPHEMVISSPLSVTTWQPSK